MQMIPLIRWHLFGILCCVSVCCFSQSLGDIQYKIEVTLDDVTHTLRGTVIIEFTNLTGEPLDQICVLLYPNAYANKETAFARQKEAFGYTDFYFAKQDQLGSIDSLDFKVNGRQQVLREDSIGPDVGWIMLDAPVQPDASCRLSTGFRVTIPESFSRLGRVGQSYQITQWFPKLAMFDAEGWHPLPYLDIGEFYSEFANYEVSVDVPDNYLVAATGELETESEMMWLDSLSNVENTPKSTFPESSARRKRLVYTAKSVHDFAWFADKRFAVRSKEVVLTSRTVTCYAFYTAVASEQWSSGVHFVADALEFFDNAVGSYPHAQMTAVEAPLAAGGGMEYPMITLIGYEPSDFTLDRVIFHEVGHQWFQGMLASNERAHAWMDEGLTSYFENRYIRQKYGGLQDDFLLHLTKRPNSYSDPQVMQQYHSHRHNLQAPDSPASDFTEDNYFQSVYLKPALAFKMLEEKLGRPSFDKIVQVYFSEWKMRHPTPTDMRSVFEAQGGEELDWLFEDIIETEQLIDYAITSYDTDTDELILKNEGRVVAPIEILGLIGSDTVMRRWYSGVVADTILSFDCDSCDRLLLYDPLYSLDSNPFNNAIHIRRGHAKRIKLKITALSGVREPGYAMINIAPFVGWNQYDKGMLGVNISNYYWPGSRFEYSLTPMFATGTNSWTGMGNVRYAMFKGSGSTDSKLRSIHLELGFRTFHFNADDHYGFEDRYYKWAPSIVFRFRPSRVWKQRRHELGYRFVSIDQSYGQGIDFDERIWQRERRGYYVNEIKYQFTNDAPVAPMSLLAIAHQGKGFVRLSLEYMQKFKFNRKDDGVEVRGFAGWLPYFDDPDALPQFFLSGVTEFGFFARDYMYDQYLLGRTEQENVLSQQIYPRDASFNNVYKGTGGSTQWMLGAGFSVDIPIPVPLQIYTNTALSSQASGTQFSFSGGIALVGLQDVVELYIPLFESRDILDDDLYGERSFWQRITVLIDLNRLTPTSIRDRWVEN